MDKWLFTLPTCLQPYYWFFKRYIGACCTWKGWTIMGKHKNKAKNFTDNKAGLVSNTNKHGVTTIGGYGQQGNYFTRELCTHPNNAIMTIGKAVIWAGS